VFRKDVRGGHTFMGDGGEGEILLSLCSTQVFVFFGLLLGMCESVRTRNTLYEVGARKSSICYNAVEGRKR